jgi:hypothetical protein
MFSGDQGVKSLETITQHITQHNITWDIHGLILHQEKNLQVLRGCVKLLPLPQPHLRTCTYARIYPSAQRDTHLKSVLAHAYYVSIQNLNSTNVP